MRSRLPSTVAAKHAPSGGRKSRWYPMALRIPPAPTQAHGGHTPMTAIRSTPTQSTTFCLGLMPENHTTREPRCEFRWACCFELATSPENQSLPLEGGKSASRSRRCGANPLTSPNLPVCRYTWQEVAHGQFAEPPPPKGAERQTGRFRSGMGTIPPNRTSWYSHPRRSWTPCEWRDRSEETVGRDSFPDSSRRLGFQTQPLGFRGSP